MNVNDQFVLDYIHERMNQSGIKSYHFQYVVLPVDADVPSVKEISNEYWFTVPPTEGLPVTILSSSDYYNLNVHQNQPRIFEFSGFMYFSEVPNTATFIPFIRVVHH